MSELLVEKKCHKKSMSKNNFDKAGLLKFSRSYFSLDWFGFHGAGHWSRVYNNGRFICSHVPEADPLVVELFAWTHDLARVDENVDYVHGKNAADLIMKELQGRFFDLNKEQLRNLLTAVIHHSEDITNAPITIQCCWDSDRLDIGRVGIIPHADYLCTEIAKKQETIDMAYDRSKKWSGCHAPVAFKNTKEFEANYLKKYALKNKQDDDYSKEWFK